MDKIKKNGNIFTGCAKFFCRKKTSVSNSSYNIKKIIGCILLTLGIVSAATCYYVLFFNREPISGSVPLTYNPAPAKNDFNITVFGDWMQAMGPLDEIAQKATENKSAFAVCLGDFVKHAEMPLMKLALGEFNKKFSMPVYATPGNHDIYDEEEASAFGSVWGNVNNCFAYGDTLFILLESAKKYIDEKQLKFLKTVLKYERPKYRRCVIFSHVPPKTNPQFDTPKYRLSEKSASDLQKILDQNNVDLIICGHVHHEMDIQFGKTKLLVTPPSGQSSRNKSNPRFGCLQIHFAANGSIEHKFVYIEKNARKNTFDQFVFYRLNQRSIFFCISLFMIICGTILINSRKKSA